MLISGPVNFVRKSTKPLENVQFMVSIVYTALQSVKKMISKTLMSSKQVK